MKSTQITIAEDQEAVWLSCPAIHSPLEIPEDASLKKIVREEPQPHREWPGVTRLQRTGLSQQQAALMQLHRSRDNASVWAGRQLPDGPPSPSHLGKEEN